MDISLLPEDAFGDRFELNDLPLSRAPAGYAVQLLDTDQLLDRQSGCFLTVRSPDLNGLFETFGDAHAAAARWVSTHCADPGEHRLAIVPAGYDGQLGRHVLIYGVLRGRP